MKIRIALCLAASTFVLSQTLHAQNTPAAGASPQTGSATANPTTPAAAPAPAPAAPAASKKPVSSDASVSDGIAVYYSDKFNGRKTYSGTRFSNKAMVAAHRTLPMGTMVRVTNQKNKKSVIVKIIDRGPSQPERVIDVSKAAATKLGFVKAGSAEVNLQVVGKAKTGTSKKG